MAWKNSLFLTAVGLILFQYSIAFAQADPEGTPDSIYFNIVTFPGLDSVLIEIRLNTDNTGLNQIAGFGLPFLVCVSNGALISLDTTVARTFAGSVASSWAILITTTDSSGGAYPTVSPVHFVFGAIDFGGGIPAGNNLLLGTIKLNVIGALLDSLCFDTMSTEHTSPTFTTAGAQDFTPRWISQWFYPFCPCRTSDVKQRKESEGTSRPTSFSLSQNYPNPFNASTLIEFDLPQVSEVSLEIYNILGQKVRVLIKERLSPGHKQIVWDGKDETRRDVASGVYFYRLEAAGKFAEAKKMILLR